ncbi:MAG: hypothetical protein OEZ35_05100 [Candidatus Bathyarchaeota archaeon]|nr:hypothetical protein [Candidatus Bathyarchaeota archaeon]
MSKEKTFSRTYRFSGQTIRELLEVQQKRDFPSITLALETIIKEAHESLQAQEKPSTLDLILHEVLGEDFYERHIEWLEEKKEEGETLEDVFRRFIYHVGMNPTKEEWKQRIQEGAKVDPFKILEPETCHYRVVNEKLEWFCDGKKIEPAVCVNRQERYLYMRQITGNPKIKCTPKSMKKTASKGRGRGTGIIIPQTTYCPLTKENVSIREVCYNKEDPCEKHKFCRYLDHYKTQLDKKRKRGEI